MELIRFSVEARIVETAEEKLATHLPRSCRSRRALSLAGPRGPAPAPRRRMLATPDQAPRLQDLLKLCRVHDGYGSRILTSSGSQTFPSHRGAWTNPSRRSTAIRSSSGGNTGRWLSGSISSRRSDSLTPGAEARNTRLRSWIRAVHPPRGDKAGRSRPSPGAGRGAAPRRTRAASAGTARAGHRPDQAPGRTARSGTPLRDTRNGPDELPPHIESMNSSIGMAIRVS